MLMVSFFTPFSEGKERDKRHEMGQWYFIFPGALHFLKTLQILKISTKT